LDPAGTADFLLYRQLMPISGKRGLCDACAMTELSIAFLGHPQPRHSGDWLHRVTWPAQALGALARTSSVQTVHPQWVKQALQADVLVVLMIAEPILTEVMRHRRAAGRATVFEISDDFAAVAAANPLKGFYARPEVQELIRQLAAQADAVQFSSDFLAEKYAHLNPCRATFRNQLLDIPPARSIAGNQPLRIGWAGSLGHLEDARLLAGWIAAWPGREAVRWCLMCGSEIAQVFERAGVKAEVRPTGSMHDYLEFLGELDVGLAWVGDDDFSRGRSDGKFLEYAAQGVLPVCRNSPVYASTLKDGVTGFLFDGETDLHRLLDRLVADPAEVRRIGEAARVHVAQKRCHAVNSSERLAFYTGLVELRSASERGCQEEISPLEADIYAGMELVNQQKYVEALSQMLGVMEREPEFFFVWQVLETICTRLGRLEEAQQCARRKAVLLYEDMPF
jgi:hypothetical protein